MSSVAIPSVAATRTMSNRNFSAFRRKIRDAILPASSKITKKALAKHNLAAEAALVAATEVALVRYPRIVRTGEEEPTVITPRQARRRARNAEISNDRADSATRRCTTNWGLRGMEGTPFWNGSGAIGPAGRASWMTHNGLSPKLR